MRELKLLTGRRIVVQAEGDVVLSGVVESATRALLTLIDARQVDARGEIPIAGVVLVPTARIQYVQVPD
jgi:hypothetical protein